MRKTFLLLLLLWLVSTLFAQDFNVDYHGKISPEIIRVELIEQIPYFNAYELDKAFHAFIREDHLSGRLMINLYNSQLIFLLDSPYLTFKGKKYNMGYPAVMHNQKPWLPTRFLSEVLPKLLPQKIAIMANNTLSAKPPVDTSLKRIVLDPGHGGKDPGAVGKKRTKEKDIVLQVAKKLKAELESKLGLEVYLTRDDDRFVSLQNRTRFANSKNADLFISLHCNASKRSSSNGVEVFFLSTSKTTDKRAQAALTLENSVVEKYEGGLEAVKKYDDLSFILMDMAQSEFLEESNQLAGRLQNNLVHAYKTADRGVKQAGFYVLKGAFMPAVLIEMGFITNPQEEKLLNGKEHQDKLVQAITEGVRSFKHKFDNMR